MYVCAQYVHVLLRRCTFTDMSTSPTANQQLAVCVVAGALVGTGLRCAAYRLPPWIHVRRAPCS